MQNLFLLGSLRSETGTTNIALVLPNESANRLKRTCFRGPKRPLAWNTVFTDAYDLMRPKNGILEPFSAWCLDMVARNIKTTKRLNNAFELDTGALVGWDMSLPIDAVQPDQLEPFAPNTRSTALRVRSDVPDPAVAPLTTWVTMVCGFRPEPERANWDVLIEWIHPGIDLGRLEGNVSRRTGRAFFDPDHPGEPRRKVYTNSF